MGSMSYCRFQNTLNDLRECFHEMDEELSPEEAKARHKLINLCFQIADDYICNYEPVYDEFGNFVEP